MYRSCIAVVLALMTLGVAADAARSGPRDSVLATRFARLTRATAWTRAEEIPIAFPTFHPQGMVRIGETFFMSAVDKTNNVGHLFKIDARGGLVADLRLGEGSIYHPGGIDYDGQSIWVPVAEYRPDSRAIVYRVDPETMKASEVFRFADHLGAIVHDTDDNTLHAVSWGSRRFYQWPLDARGTVADPAAAHPRLNPSSYVDFQDCHYAGGHMMLCGGVAELRRTATTSFRLGGLELIDLAEGRPLHQLPVALWTSTGRVMTENPMWIEPAAAGLRAFFVPEDDHSTIYVYDLKSIS
jgi:hypothetical protein